MGLTLANPLGLLALAGIPAILAIHLLQRRSRPIEVSTLFLVEPTTVASLRGRRLEHLRRSLLLWLQLLAIAVLTWLLVEPRWQQSESLQRVALVIDTSASMSAFHDEAEAAIDQNLRRLAQAAARTEWIVLASDTRVPTLYSGGDLSAAAALATGHPPRLGSHDVRPALALARSLAGKDGRVLYLTDHAPELPDGVDLLAVGSPVDNVGFAGLDLVPTAAGLEWRALVRCAAASRQTRAWWVEVDGVATARADLSIEPGSIELLSGPFPDGAERLQLHLEEDRFALDDLLPVVRPRAKPLRVAVTPSLADLPFTDHFLTTLAPVERAADPAAADLVLSSAPGGSPPALGTTAILFADAGTAYDRLLAGTIVASDDRLAEGLDWRGLAARDGRSFDRLASDRVLVWQGERPLLFIRHAMGVESLIVNFPLIASNADRIPAFVLTLNRFAETVRARRIGREGRNLVTGQALTVAADLFADRVEIDGAAARTLAPAELTRLTAPAEPGFFTVRQEDDLLLDAAAHFGDVREGDLTAAAAHEPDQGLDRPATLVHSREDPLTGLWVIALSGLALAAWAVQEGRR